MHHTHPVCSTVTAMGVSPGEERRDKEHLRCFGLSDTKSTPDASLNCPRVALIYNCSGAWQLSANSHSRMLTGRKGIKSSAQQVLFSCRFCAMSTRRIISRRKNFQLILKFGTPKPPIILVSPGLFHLNS